MSQKILVVDDTPVNVKLLADLLSAKGYTVATAASGKEALDKIEAAPPDLVLLDVMMPGMTGYEVCKKLRENRATEMLPVVMVTALDPSQERVKGIEALRQLRADATTRDIPVIAVTASALDRDRQKIMAAGFDGYQSKPLNVKDFMAAVQAMLTR